MNLSTDRPSVGIKSQRLAGDFYQGTTRSIAKELLGKTFVRKLPNGQFVGGIIVEVEAYLSSGDPASHSHRGLSKKNASMFARAGTLYVYPIHNRHCANVVTEDADKGAAVLIRAIEPVCGHHKMWHSRFASPTPGSLTTKQAMSLTQGPGRLCQAMQLDRNLDGEDLIRGSEVWIENPVRAVDQVAWRIRRSQRIGISQAKDLKLRYFIDGQRYVSGLARDHSQGRTWTFLPNDRPESVF